MLTTLLIGGIAVLAFMLLVNSVQRRELKLQWWHWLLTVLAFVFAVFTAEVIHTMVLERAQQAALVTGLVLGLPAVIWFVLLGRFVFARN
jgi:hypothetical protein